jgi:hypothetical protein
MSQIIQKKIEQIRNCKNDFSKMLMVPKWPKTYNEFFRCLKILSYFRIKIFQKLVQVINDKDVAPIFTW